MIELRIKNADGSPYWKEAFDSLPEALKWCAHEQAQPYWDKGRTVEYYDDGDLITFKDGVGSIDPVRKAARDKAKADKDAALKAVRDHYDARLASIAALRGKDLSAAEVKTAVEVLIYLAAGE